MSDIYNRVKQLEKKLEFVMEVGRMRYAIGSGLVSSDGTPVPPKIYEGSLKEIYDLARKHQTIMESEAELPEELKPALEVKKDGDAS